MPNVPGAYCPFRVSSIAGALSPCNDECALYIPSSKMPPQKSCALSILGVYALQRIIFKQQSEAPSSPEKAESPPSTPPSAGEKGREPGEGPPTPGTSPTA